MIRKSKKAPKKTYIIITMVLLIGLFSALCSADFMLRTAVFTISPKCAITMDYKVIDTDTHGNMICKITKNVPVEKATQGILTTWEIYHLGPFHYAKYLGEV